MCLDNETDVVCSFARFVEHQYGFECTMRTAMM
jgi:hypothetical protein